MAIARKIRNVSVPIKSVISVSIGSFAATTVPTTPRVQRQGDACFCNGLINRSMYAMATAEPTNVR